MTLQRDLLELGEDLFRGVYPRKGRPFHEALPFVERIGVLAGKVDVADRLALVAGDGRELSGHIAGVAALGERIRRPVLEMRSEGEARIARGGNQRSGINLVEVGEETQR